MRSVVFAAIVVIGLLAAGLFSSPAGPSAAQTGTPGGGTPGAGTPTAPADICSPTEIANASRINTVPESALEGVVAPSNPQSMGEVLYLVAMTMPPDSCYAYRELNGAVMLLVQEGAIVYTAQNAGSPDVQIRKGDNDGEISDTVNVPLDTAITLRANEWITQNKRVWFTFRNGGSDDAVLSVAVYANDPWGSDGGCPGVCRKP